MLRILIFSFISIFLLDCTKVDLITPPQKVDTIEDSSEASTSNELDAVVYDKDEPNDRSQRARLKNNEQIIYSTVTDRYGAVISSGYGDYDATDKCSDDKDCKKICDKTTRNKTRCYRQPRELVEDIQLGLFDIINISDVQEVNVNPALLKGIIDMDQDLIVKVIEKEMNEGDLRSFLAWIALNESIASVLENEDRKGEILETALKELGRKQSGSRKHFKTGLNTGLIGRDDTFLSIASTEYNEYAFRIGYELIQDDCRSNLDCKKRMLCARETRRSSRRNALKIYSVCDTPENPKQRSRRAVVCYVHGGNVWNSLDELIIDGKIRDRNFNADYDEDDKDQENELKGRLNIERCNEYCGSKKRDKCKLTL